MSETPEIPEEALEAAVVAFRDAHPEGVIVGRHEKAVRAVLVAAFPHLQPSEANPKALAETAAELGRRLGRKEAGEEIAAACLGQRIAYDETPDAFTKGWNGCAVNLSGIAREIASQGQPAASSGRTDPPASPRTPEAPETGSKRYPEYRGEDS